MKIPRDGSIERLLDRQGRLWESQKLETSSEESVSVANLTFSQRPYSGARELVSRVSERVGWEVFDSQILEALHENDELGKSVLESLDERLLNYREDWLYHLFVPGHTSSTGHVHRLSQLILSIAVRGHAIFVGRGASFIIPDDHRLAVLVTRGSASRVAHYIEECGGTEAEARRELTRQDRERGEFISKSFKHEVDDPSSYDLCVNLDTMKLETAAEIVIQALHARFPEVQRRGTV